MNAVKKIQKNEDEKQQRLEKTTATYHIAKNNNTTYQQEPSYFNSKANSIVWSNIYQIITSSYHETPQQAQEQY